MKNILYYNLFLFATCSLNSMIPSLKKICLITTAQDIKQRSLASLVTPETIQSFKMLPETFQRKIMSYVYCYQHHFSTPTIRYLSAISGDFMDIKVSEKLDSVFIPDGLDTIRKKLSDGSSYTLPFFFLNPIVQNDNLCSLNLLGSRLIISGSDNQTTSYTLNKTNYVAIEKTLLTRPEIILIDRENKQSLVQYNDTHHTGIPLFQENMDSIHYDDAEKIFMFRNGNNVSEYLANQLLF